MKFGPVPLEIYEMIKGDPLWLAELGVDELPWKLQGYRLKLTANEPEDRAVFSKSDEDCFEAGLRRSVAMNFSERTAATHGPDWQKAALGMMLYEDMIDDGPDKQAMIEDLRESSRFMRL